MKTVIITGGAQGIGLATALYLRKHNWAVMLADSDAEAGEEVSQQAEHLEYLQTNVAKETGVQKLIDQTLKRFGQINALINNAGIGITKPITKLTLAEWNKVIGVNLTGTFLCSKYAAPYLKKTRGAIVNIASSRALMSEANTEAYSASKGGIVALTHALAISLGPDVRVNAVSPGWIEVADWKKASHKRVPQHSKADQEQHPVGRVGHPNDIATMIHYLISNESSFISGQNFIVDGGMTKKMIYV